MVALILDFPGLAFKSLKLFSVKRYSIALNCRFIALKSQCYISNKFQNDRSTIFKLQKNKEIISETSYLHWLKWMRLCQTYNLFAPFRQTFGNETTVCRNNCTFDSFRIHVIVQQCFISAFEKVLFHLKSKQLSTCEIRKIILHWDLRYFQSNQPYLKKSTVQLVTC